MIAGPSGYVPFPGFLTSKSVSSNPTFPTRLTFFWLSAHTIISLRSQARFHDPLQDSLFANSSSIAHYKSWSKNASNSPSPVPTPLTEAGMLTVHTSNGSVMLPSLLTPKTQQGRRIRFVIDNLIDCRSRAHRIVSRYCILEYDPLIDSSEVEIKDWINIARDIELNYAKFDSFVILHGTDTMAYTASALSFLLEDLGKTVIMTGAQIPLSELFNDSIDNLLGALVIAASFIIPEVCLFFK